MKIVKPSVEVFFHSPWSDEKDRAIYPVDFIEQVGRTCYQSSDAIAPGTAKKFVKMLKDRGHGAMLEHGVVSAKFVCDRGVSHEIVRHRLCAFAQTSTRYVNYSKGKFGSEISVICPPGLEPESGHLHTAWRSSCEKAEKEYMWLVGQGVKPEIARSVLPTCLATELWVTTNYREWSHIFQLRCAPTAHPQIRELMQMAKDKFTSVLPEVFLDAEKKEREGKR